MSTLAEEISGLTEDEINARHHARWAEVAAQFGGDAHNVPWDIRTKLSDQNRLDWTEWVRLRDSGGHEPIKRDKTKKMWEFVNAHIGQRITAEMLAEAVDASIGTAYRFIRENKGMWFVSAGRGELLVVDFRAARAAAKQQPATPPTMGAGAGVAANADSHAQRTADDVSAALAAMTGQAVRPKGLPGKP